MIPHAKTPSVLSVATALLLAQVHEVISVRNGGEGIRVSGMITRSTARGNGGTGIFTQPGTVASGNLASHNEGNGIRCTRCTLLDNTVPDNGGIGLELNNASWGRNLSFNNNEARARFGIESRAVAERHSRPTQGALGPRWRRVLGGWLEGPPRGLGSAHLPAEERP